MSHRLSMWDKFEWGHTDNDYPAMYFVKNIKEPKTG